MRRSYSIISMSIALGLAVVPATILAQVMRPKIALPNPTAAAPVVALPTNSPIAMENTWERMPGCARHISIAALDQIWSVACGVDRRQDAAVLHWRDGNWDCGSMPGANRVAAISNMRPRANTFGGFNGVATIATSFKVYLVSSPNNEVIPSATADGQAQDISSGGQWIWGVRPPQGDQLGGVVVRSNVLPFRLGGRPQRWSYFGEIRAVRVAAGLTDGIGWIIGEDGSIWRHR